MPFATSMRRARLTWTSLRLRVQAFARTAGKSDARSIRQSLVFAWRDGTVRCGGAVALVSSRTSSSESHVLPSPSLAGLRWEFLRRFEFEGSRHCGGVICFQCTFLFDVRIDVHVASVGCVRAPRSFLRSVSLGPPSPAHLRFHSTATDGISCIHVVHEFSDQRLLVRFFAHATSVHDASLPISTVHGAFRPVVDPRSVHFAASELSFVPISVGETHHAVSVRHACVGHAFVGGAGRPLHAAPPHLLPCASCDSIHPSCRTPVRHNRATHTVVDDVRAMKRERMSGWNGGTGSMGHACTEATKRASITWMLPWQSERYPCQG